MIAAATPTEYNIGQATIERGTPARPNMAQAAATAPISATTAITAIQIIPRPYPAAAVMIGSHPTRHTLAYSGALVSAWEIEMLAIPVRTTRRAWDKARRPTSVAAGAYASP
jgi:hypothetical protein